MGLLWSRRFSIPRRSRRLAIVDAEVPQQIDEERLPAFLCEFKRAAQPAERASLPCAVVTQPKPEQPLMLGASVTSIANFALVCGSDDRGSDDW
jgi:hypothetical protein